MQNPDWLRDEIILALDLYFSPNRGSIDSTSPKVIELSNLLRKLPLVLVRPDEEKFRNPNGVSLKLSNFLAIDPNFCGKGMSVLCFGDSPCLNQQANIKQKTSIN